MPFLKKPGRQRGIVEYEFSASRLKLLVPKGSCQFILSISGSFVVRSTFTSSRNQNPTKDRSTCQRRPRLYSQPSSSTRCLCFCTFQYLFWQVEFEVITQDNHQNFIGNIWINKEVCNHAASVHTFQNLGTLLLTEGFGTVIRSVVRDSDFNAEYTAAEEVAKKLHKNVVHQFIFVLIFSRCGRTMMK